ncbi:hypothetical protein [Aquitalea denitrificans]|uniref:hypothetical protein n=1 Tax=Aquitalea denitrificans TaxID=519081 RepID=UPI0013597317|nr:hypothetical protein [Aquitalea denitrificans]
MFNKSLKISLPAAIVLALILLVLCFTYLIAINTDKAFFDKEGPLWVIIAGLIPGLTVALFQLCLSWYEYATVSKIKSLKIRDVISTRDSKKYYRELIDSSQNTLIVYGVTGSRFVQDFGDLESRNEEGKCLLKALDRKVTVKILVASCDYLENAEDKHKFSIAANHFEKLTKKWSNIEVRYFKHTPNTNLFVSDSEVIIGHVFPKIRSKDTPSLHVSLDSILAQTYIEHFNNEWEGAEVFGNA